MSVTSFYQALKLRVRCQHCNEAVTVKYLDQHNEFHCSNKLVQCTRLCHKRFPKSGIQDHEQNCSLNELVTLRLRTGPPKGADPCIEIAYFKLFYGILLHHERKNGACAVNYYDHEVNEMAIGIVPMHSVRLLARDDLRFENL